MSRTALQATAVVCTTLLCITACAARAAQVKAALRQQTAAHRGTLSAPPRRLANAPPASSRPMLALQTGHSGWIEGIAFSPDGRLVATGSMDKTARIWNARNGETLATLPGHTGFVDRLVFSPDSRTLATHAFGDPMIRVWNARSGRPLAALSAGKIPFKASLAFSTDSGRLAAIDNDGNLHLWNLHTFRSEQAIPAFSAVHADVVAFSPDSTLLAFGGYDPFPTHISRHGPQGSILLLDARNLKTVRKLPCPMFLKGLTFAPRSSKILIFGTTVESSPVGEMHLWDVQTMRETVWNTAGDSSQVSISTSGNRAAIANLPQAGHISIVDLETGKTLNEWKVQDKRLERIVLSGDGRRLYVFAFGATSTLWDTDTRKQVGSIAELIKWQAPETTLSPDGRLLAAAGGENNARLWNTDTGKLAIDLRGQPGDITEGTVAPDGRTVAVGCEDEAVRIWDVEQGRLHMTLPARGVVNAVAYAPNGRLLAGVAAYGDGGHLYLWDARTGKMAKEDAAPHIGFALAFSPDSRFLAMSPLFQEIQGYRYPAGYHASPFNRASGDQFRGGYLWNVADGMRRTELPEQPDQIAVFAFSPDSRKIASGSSSPSGRAAGAEVRQWDTVAGRPAARLRSLGYYQYAITYAPDGRTLATGSSRSDREATGRLWDAATGTLLANLEGTDLHHGAAIRPGDHEPVVALTYAPDGRTLAGSVAGQVRLWKANNGGYLATLTDQFDDFITDLAYSSDGRLLAAVGAAHRVHLWDVAAKRHVPLQRWSQLDVFPARFRRTFTTEGAALALHDPRDGRVLARLIHIPLPAEPAPTGVKSAQAPNADLWFVVTPEGYFDGSPDAARYIKWNVNGVLYPAERYLRRFRRPDLVHKALHGEPIEAPALTLDDVPPSVRIAGLKDGDPAPGDPLKLTVETRGLHQVKQVEIYVNGRPLSPGEARPIEADARPIEADARQPDAPARFLQRFTFRVSLPQGASQIHLRAVAYDETDLGSDAAEVMLHRAGVQEVTGNLYVLSVGVGRYRNGGDATGGARGQFSNLRFPASDAEAVAARFAQEGHPLYERVEVRSAINERATLDEIRAGLRWLQESVGPGQIDTVVLYLSGHGYSAPNGGYYFAPYDFDTRRIEQTGLSAGELREALGGRLRARRVFLFVDTCHSGGLRGRSEDLAASVGEGAFIVASSGANEYAYESEMWGHGAFTLGLLRSLAKRELEDNGAIRFADLVSSLRREVASLLRQSGRSDTEQEPCVPLAGRRLGEPIAHIPR